MSPVATSDAAFRGGACPTPEYTVTYTGNYTTSADASLGLCGRVSMNPACLAAFGMQDSSAFPKADDQLRGRGNAEGQALVRKISHKPAWSRAMM